MALKDNKVLQQTRTIYRGNLTRFYVETIKKIGNDLEHTLTELEELKKEHALSIKLFNSANEKLNSLECDVKRYFELLNIECKDYSSDEYYILREKLSKAGKEE